MTLTRSTSEVDDGQGVLLHGVTSDHAREVAPGTSQVVRIGGRRLRTTEVFDTYWRFAAARQAIYLARIADEPGPWTTDPILQAHRFTNCYRASDRVSQYLIQEVAYRGSQDADEVVFRVLLFKMFNKIATWELLVSQRDTPTWSDYDLNEYDRILSIAFERGQRLYSPAYVIPPPAMGAERKHTNHLLLLQHMMRAQLPNMLHEAPTMADAYHILHSFPAIGDFLAFQFLIDINYSTALDFDEMDYVVAGPGARDGIRKCFGPDSSGLESKIIEYMAEHQDEHFDRLGLRFAGLFGRKLQLVDCQNLFCEVDKYARVAHPHVQGWSSRTRIKQKFAPVTERVPVWLPPKWGLNDALPKTSRRTGERGYQPAPLGSPGPTGMQAALPW